MSSAAAPTEHLLTKLKVKGNLWNDKCSSEGFKLIGSFVSIRRAGLFLGMSVSTILGRLRQKKVPFFDFSAYLKENI